MRDGKTHEGKAYISAQRSATEENAWVSRADGHEEWPNCVEAPTREGPETTHGRRRALSDASGAGIGARRAGTPPARFRTRVRDRSSNSRAFHDAVRRRQWWGSDEAWRGGHTQTGIGSRTESRETTGARGLQTPQGRHRPRHRDRATPGNARCFVR